MVPSWQRGFDSLEARELRASVAALTGQLDPASDSGVSNTDAIINVTTPRFFGHAAPGSTVDLYANPVGTSTAVPIGQTMADINGSWSVTSTPLNDGKFNVEAIATNPATADRTTDVLLPNAAQGPLVIDTVGPKVSFVQFEPLTGRVLVTLQDQGGGLDPSTVANASNYTFASVGALPAIRTGFARPGFALAPRFQVTGVSTAPVASPGSPQTVVVSVDNNQGLPAGFYRFTIRSGGVADGAGNALDGTYAGVFPSGENRPGGNFVANLDVLKNTVLPARPVNPSFATNPGTAPTKVYEPTTRPTRIKIVGVNNKVVPLPGQHFPGTYHPTIHVPLRGR